jgi:AcrR family transcriptional regulator
MTPEDRRAAIIDATIPLLRTRGRAVTTKDISAAARVAEGTIFGVFADKDELLIAALRKALDPAPVEEQLRAIDLGLPLEERLLLAVSILQNLATLAGELLTAVQLDTMRGQLPQRYSGDHFARNVLPHVFNGFEDELRVEPVAAGRALLALVAGGANAMIFKKPMLASEVVDVLLAGIKEAPASPPRG